MPQKALALGSFALGALTGDQKTPIREMPAAPTHSQA